MTGPCASAGRSGVDGHACGVASAPALSPAVHSRRASSATWHIRCRTPTGAIRERTVTPQARARTFADLRTLGAAEVDEDSFTLAVNVDGPIAEVTSTQVLVNRGRSEHEVIYRYALPADAAITGLAVRLAGKRHEGLVVDQAAAAEEFAPGMVAVTGQQGVVEIE